MRLEHTLEIKLCINRGEKNDSVGRYMAHLIWKNEHRIFSIASHCLQRIFSPYVDKASISLKIL